MKSSKLEAAIRAGDLERVRALIASGADVSAPLSGGTAPILLAAREHQVTVVRALAGAGASLSDLEALNVEERLMLFAEASLEDDPDEEDLISAGELVSWAEQAVAEQMDDKLRAEIAAMEGDLCRAVRIGDLEQLKELIAAGSDVDQVRAVTRDTPLTLAVQAGDIEMTEELIRAGADVNHQGFSTPLSFALPDLRLVKLLLAAGADVERRGLDLRTPLERAIHRVLQPDSSADSPLLVRFFLEAGVHPPNVESVEGTLLMEAEHDEAWELYQELLPHYSDEVAGESFEELEDRQRRKEAEEDPMTWAWDLKRAASKGDLEELPELLAKSHDDFARQAGLAVRQAIAELQGAPQLEAVRLLIEAGADLGATELYESRRGTTALACAAESWHRDSKKAMRLLIDGGGDVDQRGRSGRTPLMYAAHVAYRHGAALRKAVPLLLEAGADPNLEDELGHTAWSLARAPLIEAEERSRRGDPDGEACFDGPDLSELFSDAANQADRRRGRLDRCREALELLEAAGARAHGESELRLMMASIAGDAERLEELLAAGASAGARTPDGKPALVVAAENGRREIVARLIAAGCDVDAYAPGEPPALRVAVAAGDPSMTRCLLDAGANVVTLAMSSKALADAEEAAAGSAEAREVIDMVRAALPPQIAYLDRDVAEEIASDDLYWEAKAQLPRQAAMGDLAKVREMLAIDDIEVDGFDNLRRTALAAAAEAGRLEMVDYLLEAGADPDQCNQVAGSPRSTPLVCAAISASAERDRILRRLLEAGADPDQAGADGRTALMHAVERDVGFFGRIGEFALSTRTLLAAGPDLEIRDPYGLTAWMRAMSLASSIELEDVADQYEAIGGLLEEAGASTGGLPDVQLLWAIEAGEAERVRRLLAAGASANARRHDGATALMLAARDGEHDLVQLLLDAGADAGARQWLDRGPTALAAAVEARNRRLTRILVDAGASLPDEDGHY